MRRVLFVLLAACGGGPEGPISARVTNYDYKFDIDSRVAHTAITFVAEMGGNCITLPVRGATAASLTNVTLDGEDATGAVMGDALEACGGSVDTGDSATLEADLVIPLATLEDSQVGYSIKPDRQGNPFYYLVSWVGGCDQFSPCDNRADQFATYHFTVSHPANFMVRCPGTIAEHGTSTECTFDMPGGPTYSTFGVAAYPAWTTMDKGSWGGVNVTLYDRAATNIAGAIDSAYHAGFIEWMQSQFGPYPYGSDLRILTAPTYWNGFEHPGNIVLADTLATSTNSVYANATAHTLDHEITHMWAGDQTTLANTYDFVWKEAMAEYLSFVYEDEHAATGVGLRTAAAWKLFAAPSNPSQYYPVPLDSPRPALFDFYGDAYGPGPMVLFRQLEVLTSREKVIGAIKSLLGQPHAVSVDDVLAALAQSTGLDLGGYANAWVRGSGAPDWPKYTVSYTNATNTLVLTMTNAKSTPRGCRFHVALQNSAMDQMQLVEVNTFTGGENQTITVPTPAFTVAKVVLDPLSECLVYSATTSVTRSVRMKPWVADN